MSGPGPFRPSAYSPPGRLMILVAGWPSKLGSARSFHLLCLTLTIFYVAFAAFGFARGIWIVDDKGQTIPIDFLIRWSEGRLALDGDGPAAYDPFRLRQAAIEGVCSV